MLPVECRGHAQHRGPGLARLPAIVATLPCPGVTSQASKKPCGHEQRAQHTFQRRVGNRDSLGYSTNDFVL